MQSKRRFLKHSIAVTVFRWEDDGIIHWEPGCKLLFQDDGYTAIKCRTFTKNIFVESRILYNIYIHYNKTVHLGEINKPPMILLTFSFFLQSNEYEQAVVLSFGTNELGHLFS